MAAQNNHRATLFGMPPEIRNMICNMAVDDALGIICPPTERPYGRFRLSPPGIINVSRKFREGHLPMWYDKKSIGLRLYPRTRDDVDVIWRRFQDTFGSPQTGPPVGNPHLAHIKCLEVEFWHPAYNRRRRPFSLWESDGFLFQFGDVDETRAFKDRIGTVDTDWSDRDLATKLLHEGIKKSREGRAADRLSHVNRTFPLDRLVELVMTLAKECSEAARTIRIGTSFAPR